MTSSKKTSTKRRSTHAEKRNRTTAGPYSIKSLRDELQVSQQQLAEILRVSVRTVSRWENGDVEPDLDLKKRVDRLRRLVEACFRMTKNPEVVVLWLNTPQTISCKPSELLPSERAINAFRFDELARDFSHQAMSVVQSHVPSVADPRTAAFTERR